MSLQIRINPANAFLVESVSGALATGLTGGQRQHVTSTDDWMFTGVTPYDVATGHTTGQRQHLTTAFNYSVQAPYDSQTGVSTGKRQHEPVTVSGKQNGKLTMQKSVWQMSGLMAGRSFPALHLLSTGPSGQSKGGVKILNATVVAAKPKASSVNGRMMELEEIELTFQKIETSHSSGKSTSTDDWLTGS